MPLRRPSGPLRFSQAVLSAVLVALALTVPATPTAAQAAVGRLWGQDRYATAAAISRDTFAAGVPVAFVATGGNFPDSLAGGPAAASLRAPILLVTRNGLPAATRTELSRLRPGRIVILGGEGAISTTVAGQLEALTTGGVTRFAGADRYATAAEISRAHFAAGAAVAYIATGKSFPDALAAGAAAAALGGPVLLVTSGGIPVPVRAELERLRPQRIIIVGGPGVVGDAVLNALRPYTVGEVTRQAGTNRYATAAAISAQTFPADAGGTVFLASGLGFADAVAGVPAAAIVGGPLLLAGTNTLPSETASELRRLNPSRVVLLGGTGVLGDAVGTAAASISSLTLVGPWAFAIDEYALPSIAMDQLIYYGDTLLDIYGVRDASDAYMYRAGDGTLYDHPVGQAQYVVNMLRNYRLVPDPEYMRLAVANADRLLSRAVEHRGGIFFPYGFDFGLHGRGTLKAPWYSGMAQGIALSGFVRLHEWTGETKWLDAAHRTYASFLVRPEPDKPWVTAVDGGLLWFEEYPWTPYDHTYNGHNFATFGLHDYWRLTGNEDARRLVLGGFTTTGRKASVMRVPGGVSNYCLAKSCLDRQVRNRNYHLVHISQSLYLHRYTAHEKFAALADSLVADYPDFRRGGSTIFAAGEHTAYAFDATGSASAAKTHTIGGPSSASFVERTVPHGWSRPGNGIWFFMANGVFEGLWIRESGQAYARGFVDRYGYLWPRPHAVGAGTWTGYRFDPLTDAISETLSITTAATTWQYTSSARINGDRGVLLSSGPLAGYWLPTAPGATFGPAVSGFGAASVDEPQEQLDESPASVPAPPSQPGPDLPQPMPGQMDPPPGG